MTRPQTRTRRMSNNYNDIPIGILAIQKFGRKCCPHFHWNKQLLFKSSILGLTYLAYTCYHMTRKPIAVLKPELLNCSTTHTHTHNETTDCGYAPFDGTDAAAIFGAMDSAFLFTYAIAMFGSGFIAERVSLRYFLAFGMMFSGLFTYLFGVAKPLNIHSTAYFLFVQICAGVFQTTGWPGVVTLVGRWFGKSKRGSIFGIWNSHTSIGNILGTLIAAYYVETDWSMSFIMPGIIMAVVGFLLFLLVVDAPEIVGLQTQRGVLERRPSNDSDIEDGGDGENITNNDANVRNYSSILDSGINYRPTERTPILANPSAPIATAMQRPIGLLDALYIPGVIEFSLCLFFSKLVSYTFLYWLPLYIQSSSTLGPSHSAELSTAFDVGGIIGAIVAGMISDYTGMSATTCTVMLIFASPVLLMYQQYGAISATVSIVLLGVAGILVNGPYALITTSVSAELGQHSSLEGNSKALATVTAIIDGTGSIGAAVGPLLAGVVSTSHGWQDVFYMLIIADILAMLLLLRLVMKEFAKLRRRTGRIRIE